MQVILSHGDRMLSEESGTPWLNYDFELVEKPSSLSELIFIWILLLATKPMQSCFALVIFSIYLFRKK